MTSKQQELPPQYTPAPQSDPAQGGYAYPQQDYPQQGYPPQQQYMYPAAGQQGYVYPARTAGGQPVYQQPMPVNMMVTPAVVNPPQDYMIFNIIMTIFCCWPIGIFAILKSMACRDAINRGEVTAAQRLSNEAKRLGYWTLGVGIFFVVASIVIIVAVYAAILIPIWNSDAGFGPRD